MIYAARSKVFFNTLWHIYDAKHFWIDNLLSGTIPPTADATALDIDVLLAAQALQLGGDPLIATTNQKHLSQFVSARNWAEIEPTIFGLAEL